MLQQKEEQEQSEESKLKKRDILREKNGSTSIVTTKSEGTNSVVDVIYTRVVTTIIPPTLYMVKKHKEEMTASSHEHTQTPSQKSDDKNVSQEIEAAETISLQPLSEYLDSASEIIKNWENISSKELIQELLLNEISILRHRTEQSDQTDETEHQCEKVPEESITTKNESTLDNSSPKGTQQTVVATASLQEDVDESSPSTRRATSRRPPTRPTASAERVAFAFDAALRGEVKTIKDLIVLMRKEYLLND